MRVWAKSLAAHYRLDAQWIEEILIKTAERLQFEHDHRRKYSGNLILKDFSPSLVEALEALPVDEVKKLFTQDDEHLLQLRENERRWHDLLRSPIPVQTFDRILYVADDFKTYLARATHDVVNRGQPLGFFRGSEWLQRTFTACWQTPKIEAGVLEDFDDEIIQPPKLPSFAEIMEKNSHIIKAPEFDQSVKYRSRPREGVIYTPIYRSHIAIIKRKNPTPERAEFWAKHSSLTKTKDYADKIKALRLGLHRFSEDSFSLLVNVLKNRKNKNGVILAEKLVAECWNSFMKHLNPLQIDVLTGRGLDYFGFPNYSSEDYGWFYGGSTHITVFEMANLMEKIISGKWDEKIQVPLSGISEYFVDDETGEERFRCTYFQARAVCGAGKVDAALRAIDNLWGEFQSAKEQAKADITENTTAKNNNELDRAKEAAFLDYRAIERIKAMGAYVVFPEGKRAPTLKEIIEQNPRPVGMIDDCAAFVPKNANPILFEGTKQRAVIRFLFSRCDSKPKYSATLEEIIRDVCTEEEANKIIKRRKVDPDSWRLDRTWFDGHSAWKTVLKRVPRDEGALVQKPLSYYLDLNYGNEESAPPPPKVKTPPKKQKHGPGITFSSNAKNKSKKKAV